MDVAEDGNDVVLSLGREEKKVGCASKKRKQWNKIADIEDMCCEVNKINFRPIYCFNTMPYKMQFPLQKTIHLNNQA